MVMVDAKGSSSIKLKKGSSSTAATAGDLIRDDHGYWVIGSRRFIGIKAPLAAKLRTLRDGLQLAIDP